MKTLYTSSPSLSSTPLYIMSVNPIVYIDIKTSNTYIAIRTIYKVLKEVAFPVIIISEDI